jgi:CO/xanthine dehydrogenase FAD-binding subunit
VLLGLPEFEWLSTRTVEQTCALLAEHGEDTVVIAGGTDLLTKMKHRRLVPRCLVNIKKIPGLSEIRYNEREGLRIGALTTIRAIETSLLIGRHFPMLRQAAAALGTLQIRNTATLGGNLANASPSAEFAPPLLALDAALVCVTNGANRVVPLQEFFLAPGKTVLRKDELIAEVRVPGVRTGARSIYLKHSLRRMDVATANVALLVGFDGEVCSEARIALGAVGPTPMRARKAEEMLRGQRLSAGAPGSALVSNVARMAADESLPIDDLRAYADHRRKLVAMLVGKGLELLLQGAAI